MVSFEKAKNHCQFWFIYMSMMQTIQCSYPHKTLLSFRWVGVKDHSVGEGKRTILMHSVFFAQHVN